MEKRNNQKMEKAKEKTKNLINILFEVFLIFLKFLLNSVSYTQLLDLIDYPILVVDIVASMVFEQEFETIKKEEGEYSGEDGRIQTQPLAEATGTGKQTPDNNNSKDADTLLVNSNYKALENSEEKEEQEEQNLDAFSGKKTSSSPKNDNLNSFSVR